MDIVKRLVNDEVLNLLTYYGTLVLVWIALRKADTLVYVDLFLLVV
jgi:hypothetical protein